MVISPMMGWDSLCMSMMNMSSLTGQLTRNTGTSRVISKMVQSLMSSSTLLDFKAKRHILFLLCILVLLFVPYCLEFCSVLFHSCLP